MGTRLENAFSLLDDQEGDDVSKLAVNYAAKNKVAGNFAAKNKVSSRPSTAESRQSKPSSDYYRERYSGNNSRQFVSTKDYLECKKQERNDYLERQKRREEEDKKQKTLEQYEKELNEKKALGVLKTEVRKVDPDKEFESMKVVSKKDEDDALVKLDSGKDKNKKKDKRKTVLDWYALKAQAEAEAELKKQAQGGRPGGQGGGRGGNSGVWGGSGSYSGGRGSYSGGRGASNSGGRGNYSGGSS